MFNTKPSFSQSLGKPHLYLDDFIAYLTPLDPKDSSKKTVTVACQSLVSENLKASISYLVDNLINRQFSDLKKESVRELISNAIDAQVRSGREKEVINIFLDKRQLIIEDAGDGLTWEAFVNYFVPGRSSNALALFDLDQGVPNITGRFGQGGLSIYSYLKEEAQDYLPTIERNGDEVLLKILYTVEENSYEVIFRSSLEKQVTDYSQQELMRTHKKNKVTIYTKRGAEALKLIFWEHQGQIVFDIQTTTKPLEGTRFKVRSTLFEKEHEALAAYIQQVFCFTRPTPLSLNNKIINQMEEFDAFHTEDLSLFYNSFGEKGTLFVCEKGKVITQFAIKGVDIPQVLAIDFKSLPLTQDRSTLDFKDPKALQALTVLISSILASADLNNLQKSALLNALYQIKSIVP